MLFHITDMFSISQPTKLLSVTHTDCPKLPHILFVSHSYSPWLWSQRPKAFHSARNLTGTHPRKARGRAFHIQEPSPLIQPTHFRQVISFPYSVIRHNLTLLRCYELPILLSAHQQVFKDKAMETRPHSWEQKTEQAFIRVYTNIS